MAPAHAHDDHEGHDGHDHDGHDHAGHEHGPLDTRIRVLHGASPFCHWSFGYEPVLERLRLVYGDQVKINVYQVPVYTSWQQWKEDYEMTDPAQLRAWIGEAAGLLGIPFDMRFLDRQTKDCTPGTLVVHAAEIAHEGAGERLARLMNFLLVTEAKVFDDEGELLRMAEKLGAPRKAVEQALASGAAAERMAQDRSDMHALGVNFYALQLRDFEGRTVTLEHAFDPAKAEEALEWLSRGQLRKRSLPKLEDFARASAPVHELELARIFHRSPEQVRAALAPLEKEGALRRAERNGLATWTVP